MTITREKLKEWLYYYPKLIPQKGVWLNITEWKQILDTIDTLLTENEGLKGEIEKFKEYATKAICSYCGHIGPKKQYFILRHLLKCKKHPWTKALDGKATAEKEREKIFTLYQTSLKTNEHQAQTSIQQRKEIETLKSANEFLSKCVDSRQQEIEMATALIPESCREESLISKIKRVLDNLSNFQKANETLNDRNRALEKVVDAAQEAANMSTDIASIVYLRIKLQALAATEVGA